MRNLIIALISTLSLALVGCGVNGQNVPGEQHTTIGEVVQTTTGTNPTYVLERAPAPKPSTTTSIFTRPARATRDYVRKAVTPVKPTPITVIKAKPKAIVKPIVRKVSTIKHYTGYKQYAYRLVGSTQFPCLNRLWTRESHWNPNSQNRNSTAYGIPQFLNSTWRDIGFRKTSNPFVQIRAGLKYIKQRYGTPCRAWAHSESYGFY